MPLKRININQQSGATRLRCAKCVKRDVVKGKEIYKRDTCQSKNKNLYQYKEWCDATDVHQICQKRRIESKRDLQKRPISIKRVVRRDRCTPNMSKEPHEKKTLPIKKAYINQ